MSLEIDTISAAAQTAAVFCFLPFVFVWQSSGIIFAAGKLTEHFLA